MPEVAIYIWNYRTLEFFATFSTITWSDHLFPDWTINQVQTDSNFTEKLQEWFEYGILKLMHTVWIENSKMNTGNLAMKVEMSAKTDVIKILVHRMMW